MDVIFLDLAKAFDKVAHTRLMNKVRAHGIQGLIGNWIENWSKGSVTFRDSTLNTANLCPAISVVGLFYLLTVIMNFVCWFIFRCRFLFCMCA